MPMEKTGRLIISGSITTTGNPVQIMVTGDANPTTTAWCRLQIFRDGNGIGNIIQVENSSNLNVPYCLNVIDTPPAGTYNCDCGYGCQAQIGACESYCIQCGGGPEEFA